MTLPIPSPAEQLHSERLTALIREKISVQNGIISFAEFMQHALYAPGLGYYVAGKHKFGAQGDFVTAPEISPLFSRCIAKQAASVLQALPEGNILEFGAGSGKMAATILQTLTELNCLPKHYFILEVSPDLQAYQRETIAQHAPQLLERVQWLNSLPEKFAGIMLANEVMDAFPVHIFTWTGKECLEQGVSFSETENKFMWSALNPLCPPSQKEKFFDPIFLTRTISPFEKGELRGILSPSTLNLQSSILPAGYTSEINLMIEPWLKSLSDTLQQGIILLIDYGFTREEYYHPERDTGTLMCHYKHHAHTDPLINVGLQDITAHVDFTTVFAAAATCGLEIAYYSNQANFLLDNDILVEYEKYLPSEPQKKYNFQQQLLKLIEPHEMGELFKVCLLSKSLSLPF